MTKISSISVKALVSFTVLAGGLILFQAAARSPQSDLISAPSGEARPLPVDMMRLKPAMW